MKAFLFDVDDTLYDQRRPFQEAYQKTFENRFDVDLHALYIASRRRGDEVFGPSQRGEITMREMYIYRMQKAFEDLQIAVTDQEALQFQEHYSHAQQNLCMSQTMTGLLDALKCRQAMIGIITNGPGAHQRKKAQILHMERWTAKRHIYVSGELQIMKPDPRIFQYALEDMGLEREQTCYIGDSFENDMKGARGAGLVSVWMNRRNYQIPRGEQEPDYHVHTEEELAQCLLQLADE